MVGEIRDLPARRHGSSKLDGAILWDTGVAAAHASLHLRRAGHRFGLVGASAGSTDHHRSADEPAGTQLAARPIAVITAASSNYLLNNALTFRDRRQKGARLLRGLLKFLLVASLPALANVGLATSFYTLVNEHAIWAQLAGILVVYVWNYAASSRFVWNTP